MTGTDRAAAFVAFVKARDATKRLAGTVVAGLAIQRSADAPAFHMAPHDAIAEFAGGIIMLLEVAVSTTLTAAATVAASVDDEATGAELFDNISASIGTMAASNRARLLGAVTEMFPAPRLERKDGIAGDHGRAPSLPPDRGRDQRDGTQPTDDLSARASRRLPPARPAVRQFRGLVVVAGRRMEVCATSAAVRLTPFLCLAWSFER